MSISSSLGTFVGGASDFSRFVVEGNLSVPISPTLPIGIALDVGLGKRGPDDSHVQSIAVGIEGGAAAIVAVTSNITVGLSGINGGN